MKVKVANSNSPEPAPRAAASAAPVTEPEEKEEEKKEEEEKKKNVCLNNFLRPRSPKKRLKRKRKSPKRKREKRAWKNIPLHNLVILTERLIQPSTKKSCHSYSGTNIQHQTEHVTAGNFSPPDCTARQTRQVQQLRDAKRQSQRRYKGLIGLNRPLKEPGLGLD